MEREIRLAWSSDTVGAQPRQRRIRHPLFNHFLKLHAEYVYASIGVKIVASGSS